MRKLSKILALILTFALCVSCFAGCSLFDKSPKTAAELITKSKEVMTDIGSNMQVDMEVKMNFELEMEEEGAKVDMELPLTMEAKMQLCGDYSHSKMEMSGEAKATVEYEGEKETQTEEMDSESESYTVTKDGKVITYTTSSDDEDVWYVTEEDKEDDVDINEVLDEEAFKDVELVKNDDGYELTVKFADILKNEKMREWLEDNADMDDFEDIDFDDLVDAFGDAAATYKFDKEYRLIEMYTSDIDVDFGKLVGSALDEIGLPANDIKLSMSMSAKLSKFGEIKESDVKVPDDVKDEAIEEEDWFDEDIDIDVDEDDNDDNNSNDDNSTDVEVDAPVISDGVMSDDWTDMTVEIDGVIYVYPYDYDLLTANGWSIDLKGMGYEDGYILNKNDQLSSTIDMYNEKYNDPESYDSFTFWCGFQNFSDKAADITECDLWSIELDIMNGFEPVEKYPSVKIAKGITWGDNRDKVVEAFGEPDDEYTSKGDGYDYSRLEWRSDDGQYMTITVDAQYGVTAFEFDAY